jgi:hypothetical protein
LAWTKITYAPSCAAIVFKASINAVAIPVRRWGSATAQVVDVDLAALLLELVEHVGGETPEHRRILDRGKRDEPLAAEQPREIIVAGPGRAVSLDLAERFAEHGQHRVHGA